MAQGYGYRSEQRLRKENQDTYGVFEFDGFTLLVVCDGMGGNVGGRQASSLAVRTMHDELKGYSGTDLRGALRRAIEAANRAIYDTARKNYRLMGMGTTCVAAIVQGTTAHVGHVGDSRAYLVRDGQTKVLTRDHTMVNLFVDAELLSPEDAATHPEAHVLSRSLGVERQVEVDLGEPISLQQGDRILLCSDGVHGVIGNAGLGGVDWRNPQEGVDAAVDAVVRAEGDDNATLVAYGLGISGASSPTTEPPDLSALEEEARQAPMQVPLNQQRRPTLAPVTSTGEPDVVPMDALGDGDLEAVRATPQPVPTAKPRKGVDRRLVLAIAAIGVVGVVAAAALVAGGSRDTGRTTPRPTATSTAAVSVRPVEPTPSALPNTGSPMGAPELGASDEPLLLAGQGTRGMYRTRCLDCSSSLALPTAAAYLSSANDPEAAVAFFAPEIPPAPRRVPNTQSVYDHPPPSGPEQTSAVRAARNKRCREAIDTVRSAITKSIDYASLYGAAWYCFNDTHAAVLSKARASTWNEFRPLTEHFEGTRTIPPELLPDPVAATLEAAAEATEQQVPPTPEGAAAVAASAPKLPDQPDTWKVPAAGGLEYRLALFELDDDVQGFRAIIVDLLGEPTVADHLATDVLLIATAAASTARMETPTPDGLQTWARRVYVASRAMTGPVGELIRAHRPEVAGMIEALLFEATGGDEGLLAIEEGFPNEAVPAVVARAQAAGLAGQMENVLAEGATEALLPAEQLASLDGDLDDRGASSSSSRRSSGRSSSYARNRRSEVSTARGLSDPSSFDWDTFGYLKVWYPRQRMPRVLLPYQREGQVDAGDADAAPSFDEVELYRRNRERIDADWEAPAPSKPKR